MLSDEEPDDSLDEDPDEEPDELSLPPSVRGPVVAGSRQGPVVVVSPASVELASLESPVPDSAGDVVRLSEDDVSVLSAPPPSEVKHEPEQAAVFRPSATRTSGGSFSMFIPSS